MTKPILCLDFDGVIHSYTSYWQGAEVIPDPPVDGAIEFMLTALHDFDVVIFSSRSNQPGGLAAMKTWLKHHAGNCWHESPCGPGLEDVRFVTEKPPAMVTLDDRALTFIGQWPKVSGLLSFKPWNKGGSAPEAAESAVPARVQCNRVLRVVNAYALSGHIGDRGVCGEAMDAIREALAAPAVAAAPVAELPPDVLSAIGWLHRLSAPGEYADRLGALSDWIKKHPLAALAGNTPAGGEAQAKASIAPNQLRKALNDWDEVCENECEDWEQAYAVIEEARAILDCIALAANPSTAAAPRADALTDALILHRWDTHVGELSAGATIEDSDKIFFARAIEGEVLAAMSRTADQEPQQ